MLTTGGDGRSTWLTTLRGSFGNGMIGIDGYSSQPKPRGVGGKGGGGARLREVVVSNNRRNSNLLLADSRLRPCFWGLVGEGGAAATAAVLPSRLTVVRLPQRRRTIRTFDISGFNFREMVMYSRGLKVNRYLHSCRALGVTEKRSSC